MTYELAHLLLHQAVYWPSEYIGVDICGRPSAMKKEALILARKFSPKAFSCDYQTGRVFLGKKLRGEAATEYLAGLAEWYEQKLAKEGFVLEDELCRLARNWHDPSPPEGYIHFPKGLHRALGVPVFAVRCICYHTDGNGKIGTIFLGVREDTRPGTNSLREFDYTFAGNLDATLAFDENLLREAEEEASLSKKQLGGLYAIGRFGTIKTVSTGLNHGVHHLWAAELAHGDKPAPGYSNEMLEFREFTPEQVLNSLQNPKAFLTDSRDEGIPFKLDLSIALAMFFVHAQEKGLLPQDIRIRNAAYVKSKIAKELEPFSIHVYRKKTDQPYRPARPAAGARSGRRRPVIGHAKAA